jgi:hypothetical protein
MNRQVNITESEQVLARLARGTREVSESSVLKSSGGMVGSFAAVVEGLSSYNFYKVRMIEIGLAGSLPIEAGEQMEAVNLAESFLSAGQLASGTYVVIHRAGDKYIFYANP